MRNIAVLGSGIRGASVLIDGVTATVGCIDTPEPTFRPTVGEFRGSVLVRKKAFSVNFRDKRSIVLAAMRGTPNGYYILGSDFSGVVIETGTDVTGFRVGDRVIGNNSYQDNAAAAGMPGLATRHASREYEIFDAAKLAKIPDSMPYETAAAFGIGAQTAQAMIRRLEICACGSVLVTAARSSTALFAIALLRHRGVQVFAATTSKGFEEQFRSIGVVGMFDIGNVDLTGDSPRFGYVIDPFFDVYCAAALEVMAKGGKYISCGLLNQTGDVLAAGQEVRTWGVRQTVLMLVRNLHIIGNCMGTSEDLQCALREYAADRLEVTIDSIYSGEQVGEFVDRTYNAPDRFGKVVYKYE